MLRLVFPFISNTKMSSTNNNTALAKIIQVMNNVDVPLQIFDFKQKYTIELGKKDFGNVVARVEVHNGLIAVKNIFPSGDILVSVGGNFLHVNETVEWRESVILRIGFMNVYFYNVLRSDVLHEILMKECFVRDAKTHGFSNNESDLAANNNVSTATTFHTATTGNSANRRLGDLTVRETIITSANASSSATLIDSSIETSFDLYNKEDRRFHKPTHDKCPTDLSWCRNLRKFYGAMIDQLPRCSECRNKKSPVVNWNNFQTEICDTEFKSRQILCPACLIDLTPEQRGKFVAYNQNDRYYNRQYALFRKKYDELMKTIEKIVSKRAEFLLQVRQLTTTVLKNMEKLETVTEDLTAYVKDGQDSIFDARFLSRMSESRRRVLFEKVETYLNGTVKVALEEAREVVANHELSLLELKKRATEKVD